VLVTIGPKSPDGFGRSTATCSNEQESPAQAGGTLVAEGRDFATEVLRDPWDMNAISDISVYLNRSGQSYDTQNIQLANGVFSAQSTGTADTNFTVLFPGYTGALTSGREGARHPIDSSVYRCLYVAMQVEGGGSQAQVIPAQSRDLGGFDRPVYG
jgi:hypothetical protein